MALRRLSGGWPSLTAVTSRNLLPLVLAISVALAGCSATSVAVPSVAGTPAVVLGSPTAASGSVPAQTSDGGQVTAAVAWTGSPSELSFDVKLDTHSVDLAALDLSNTVLRNNRGQTLRARPWSAPAGSHHRDGRLDFDGDAAAFLAGSTWLELVIVGVGDLPERTLRWAIGG